MCVCVRVTCPWNVLGFRSSVLSSPIHGGLVLSVLTSSLQNILHTHQHNIPQLKYDLTETLTD